VRNGLGIGSDGAMPSPERPSSTPPVSRRPWSARLIAAAVAITLGAVAWLLGTAVIPRWWAQRVGDRVDGSLTSGYAFGVGLGAACTFGSLLALSLAWRLRRRRRTFGALILGALAISSPNLATLGIVIGDGNAAHAGQRILDVEGPGFRTGSLMGVIAGAAAFALGSYLLWSRARARSRTKDLTGRLREAEARDRRDDSNGGGTSSG
jgi:hypothetical protein